MRGVNILENTEAVAVSRSAEDDGFFVSGRSCSPARIHQHADFMMRTYTKSEPLNQEVE